MTEMAGESELAEPNVAEPNAAEPNVAELLARVRRQREEVLRVQRAVAALRITGHSRNNEVTATVQGTGRFTEISIDPETVHRHAVRDLGGLVLEAVNDALRKLSAASTARYAPIIEAADRPDRG